MDPESFLAAHAGSRLPLIAESHLRLTGRPLLGDGEGLWSARQVLLAHGFEADPLFFYGNRRALELFEVSAKALIRMPSRLSAEVPDRAERTRLLDQVARRGFIEDYAGVRVSASGKRFRIERATVWNLVDACGAVHGQAAAFASYVRLTSPDAPGR